MIRCARCKRWTSNNRCDVKGDIAGEHIANARGDCSRCSPGIKVESEGWEDWFPGVSSVLWPDAANTDNEERGDG